jgi:uncharacterized integral membrane protein
MDQAMLHKLFMMFVVVPLGILFVVFAVANRHAVTVTLDPFGSDAGTLSATMPLFMLILALIGAGVLFGGMITWINQGKWRRAARRAEAEGRDLRIEREALKMEMAAREARALPPPEPSL